MSDHLKTLQSIKAQIRTHDCPKCEGAAYCAMEAGKSANTCWCMTVEREARPEGADLGDVCLCRSCLTGEQSTQEGVVHDVSPVA